MKYRKKAIVIDAIKFEYSKDGIALLKEFCGEYLGQTNKDRHMGAIGEAVIITLEDGNENQVTHVASEGDYVIKGVQGEFYPCKPDIFHATYDKVDE